MISGALFIDRDISIKRLYSKYILRIATAFVFWSIVYAIIKSGINFRAILYGCATGGPRFAFLCYIVGLYIISPILKKICENKKLTYYFLSICIIFTFVFPQFEYIVNMLPFDGFKGLANCLFDLVDKMDVQFAMGMTGYFLLGYVLSKVSISKRHRTIIYFAGVIGTIVTIFFTVFQSLCANEPVFDWLNYCWLNVLFESIAIFVFTKYFFNNHQHVGALKVRVLSECTFGIFLVHTAILDFFLPDIVGINANCINAVVGIAIMAILSFSISFGISFFLNHIPGLKNYIV